MIEKSTKKAVKKSAPAPRATESSSADNLKKGLEKGTSTVAPSLPPSRPAPSSQARATETRPPSSGSDRLQASDELARTSPRARPQFSVLEGIRGSLGEGDSAPASSLTRKIGDILSGSAGKLQSLMRFDRQSETQGARPTSAAPKETQAWLGDPQPDDRAAEAGWGASLPWRQVDFSSKNVAASQLDTSARGDRFNSERAPAGKDEPKKKAEGASTDAARPLEAKAGDRPSIPGEPKKKVEGGGSDAARSLEAKAGDGPSVSGELKKKADVARPLEAKAGDGPTGPGEPKKKAEEVPFPRRGEKRSEEGLRQAQEEEARHLGRPLASSPDLTPQARAGDSIAGVAETRERQGTIEQATRALSGDGPSVPGELKKKAEGSSTDTTRPPEVKAGHGPSVRGELKKKAEGSSTDATRPPEAKAGDRPTVSGEPKKKAEEVPFPRRGEKRSEEGLRQAQEEEVRHLGRPLASSPELTPQARAGDSVAGPGAVAEARERQGTIQQATRALSGDEKQAVERALNNPRIDTEILKDLTRDGFGIYQVDEKDRRLKDGQGRSREGFYNYDDNRIRISESAFSRPEVLNKVLADELGHRIDDRLRTSPETSEKWSRMMDRYLAQERSNPRLDQNARKNVGEFSSEVISSYLRGGPEEARLRQTYPELHRVLRETVGQADNSDLQSRPNLMSRFLGSDRIQQAQVQRNQLSGQYFSDSVQPAMPVAQSTGGPGKAPSRTPVEQAPAAVRSQGRSPEAPPAPSAVPSSPQAGAARAVDSPQPVVAPPRPSSVASSGNSPGSPAVASPGEPTAGRSYGPAPSNPQPRMFESARPSNHPQLLGSAQQMLSNDLALLQSPALLEMQNLSQQWSTLEGIPESLTSLESLRALGPSLDGLPETLRGLGQVGQLLDRVKQLPGSVRELRQRPELHGLIRELPQIADRLSGLHGLAARGAELKAGLAQLDRLKVTAPTFAPRASPAARFEQLSQDWVRAREDGKRDPALPRQVADDGLGRFQAQLERGPLQAARGDRLPRMRQQLQPVVQGLQQVARQGDGVQRLHHWTRQPENLQQDLQRLEGLAGSERGSLRPLRNALAPLSPEHPGRTGLQQASESLAELQGPRGRTRLSVARQLGQENPGWTAGAAEVRRPGLSQAFRKVSEQLSDVRESRRAGEAYLKVNPGLPQSSESDLGSSLATILQAAEAAQRPRKLFGISLGPAAPQPAQAAPVVPSPQSGAPPTARPREVMSRARIEAYRDSYETMRQQMQGRGKSEHAWALVYHSREAEGARGLADTLESTVARAGSSKLQAWLRQMTETPDSSVALSAIMANVSQVTPERMVGILLLTTDGQGGREAVGESFQRMAQEVDGSLRLAHFLDQSTRHPLAARGVAELLETLSEPKGDDWSGSRQLAGSFLGMSETVGGARRLGQALENLGEIEGGNRLVSKTLLRLTRTAEGGRDLLESLQNLAHDKEGARQIGGVLARAGQSRDGARDLLGALQNMARGPAGREEVGRLFLQLSEAGQGSKLLANLARDGHNAAPMAQLFEQLNRSPESREMLGYALRQMESAPRERAQFEIFQGRVAVCEPLKAAYEVALGESEPVTALGKRSREPESAATAPAPVHPTTLGGPEPADSRTLVSELQKYREDIRQEEIQRPWQGEAPEGTHFRPGDVYSEETLRQARICPECGSRTSVQGWCPRCLTREQQRN